MRKEGWDWRGMTVCFVLMLLYPILITPKLQTITQAKPDYLTSEFGVPSGMPSEVRVPGDFLVSFSKQINELRYFFRVYNEDYTLPTLSDEPVLIFVPTGQNCKTLLAPGTVTYRMFDWEGRVGDVRYSSRKHRELPIKPAEGLKQFRLSEIRDCCDASCPANNFAVPKQTLTMLVYEKDTMHRIYGGQCTFCAIKDGTRTCRNGQYATEYSLMDQVDAVKFD